MDKRKRLLCELDCLFHRRRNLNRLELLWIEVGMPESAKRCKQIAFKNYCHILKIVFKSIEKANGLDFYYLQSLLLYVCKIVGMKFGLKKKVS